MGMGMSMRMAAMAMPAQEMTAMYLPEWPAMQLTQPAQALQMQGMQNFSGGRQHYCSRYQSQPPTLPHLQALVMGHRVLRLTLVQPFAAQYKCPSARSLIVCKNL